MQNFQQKPNPNEPMLVFKPLSAEAMELNRFADDYLSHLESINFDGHEDIKSSAEEIYKWAILYNVDRSMYVMYIADVIIYRVQMEHAEFSDFDKRLIGRLACRYLSKYYEN